MPRRLERAGGVFAGGHACGATPVPIPNTAVKPAGPMILLQRESRSPPAIFLLHTQRRPGYCPGRLRFGLHNRMALEPEATKRLGNPSALSEARRRLDCCWGPLCLETRCPGKRTCHRSCATAPGGGRILFRPSSATASASLTAWLDSCDFLAVAAELVRVGRPVHCHTAVGRAPRRYRQSIRTVAWLRSRREQVSESTRRRNRPSRRFSTPRPEPCDGPDHCGTIDRSKSRHRQGLNETGRPCSSSGRKYPLML
jgi:hypothetical protein